MKSVDNYPRKATEILNQSLQYKFQRRFPKIILKSFSETGHDVLFRTFDRLS